MLSPDEAAAVERGQVFKRFIRAAAALQDVFDDVTLGEAVGRNRGAVAGWWRGSRPEPDVLFRLAELTRLSSDELARFVYQGGPPPRLPEGSGPAGLLEGVRRAEERRAPEARDTPAPSPERLPRDAGAERA